MEKPDQAPPDSDALNAEVVPLVITALTDIRQGSLEIVVHDGRITYIERREQEEVDFACPRGEDPCASIAGPPGDRRFDDM